MAYNSTTFVGSLSQDPELRYTPSGMAVCEFRLGQKINKKGDPDKWTNMNCVCWGTLAENVAASLGKGDRVIATGRVEEETYEKDGQRRWVTKMKCDAIGAELSWVTCNIERTERDRS